MTAPVSIRLGDQRDRDYALDLGRRVAASSISSIRPVPVPLVEAAFDRLMRDIAGRQYDLLVAHDDVRPYGFLLLLRDLPDEVTMSEQAFVAYMAVEPEMQTRGIGTQLLRAAEDLARADGLAFLCLMVTEDNTAARKVYERFGLQTERRMMTKALQ